MKTAGREKVVRKIKVKEDELVGYRAAYDVGLFAAFAGCY